MKLLLSRYHHDKYGTFGQLFLLDELSHTYPLCYTLEPSYESKDLFGAREIEEGDYKLSLSHSNRFKRVLPYVNHPHRYGIRIHAGNTVQDTQGCILVGLVSKPHGLVYSRLALTHVMNVIQQLSIQHIKILNNYGKVSNVEGVSTLVVDALNSDYKRDFDLSF